MKFKKVMEDKLLPIIKYKDLRKTVIDFRKEWYIKESEKGPRISRIPQYALIEYKILKQGNDVEELLKEVDIKTNHVCTILTLEEAEQFKLKTGEGFLK